MPLKGQSQELVRCQAFGAVQLRSQLKEFLVCVCDEGRSYGLLNNGPIVQLEAEDVLFRLLGVVGREEGIGRCFRENAKVGRLVRTPIVRCCDVRALLARQ